MTSKARIRRFSAAFCLHLLHSLSTNEAIFAQCSILKLSSSNFSTHMGEDWNQNAEGSIRMIQQGTREFAIRFHSPSCCFFWSISCHLCSYILSILRKIDFEDFADIPMDLSRSRWAWWISVIAHQGSNATRLHVGVNIATFIPMAVDNGLWLSPSLHLVCLIQLKVLFNVLLTAMLATSTGRQTRVLSGSRILSVHQKLPLCILHSSSLMFWGLEVWRTLLHSAGICWAFWC